MIELNGSGVTGTFNSVGLRLGAPDIVVQGLVINRFVAGVQISPWGSLDTVVLLARCDPRR